MGILYPPTSGGGTIPVIDGAKFQYASVAPWPDNYQDYKWKNLYIGIFGGSSVSTGPWPMDDGASFFQECYDGNFNSGSSIYGDLTVLLSGHVGSVLQNDVYNTTTSLIQMTTIINDDGVSYCDQINMDQGSTGANNSLGVFTTHQTQPLAISLNQDLGGNGSIVNAINVAVITSFAQQSASSGGANWQLNLTSCTSFTVDTSTGIQTNGGGGTYTFNLGAVPDTDVNAILAAFVSDSSCNSGALTIGGSSASPTGQGIVDVATLQLRGMSVTTN